MSDPTFINLVAQRTGIAPSVLQAWVAAEGGPASNPLNIGPGQNFGNETGAANATSNLLTRGPSWAGYNQIIKAAKTGNQEATIKAIKASHWDATHYSNGVLDRTAASQGISQTGGSQTISSSPPGAQGSLQKPAGGFGGGVLQPGFTPQAILASSLLSAAHGGGQIDPSTFLASLTQARQAQLQMGQLGGQQTQPQQPQTQATPYGGQPSRNTTGFEPVAGKVIGTPYSGTHGVVFNTRGGSNNWESENAVDVATPVGTPIRAVAAGKIGSQFGSLGEGGRFAGLRLHLVTSNNEYYYAHLSKFADGIRPGVEVQPGQIIGYSGEANGVAHLHFASSNGNPTSFYGGN